MKDKRIWEFKRRAEEDNLITAGACRLILRIASWRYCTRHHPADAEFSLTWREMASWYDNEGPEVVSNKRTIYGWIRELVQNKYLFFNGAKGCPPQSHYRVDLDHKPQALTLFDWAAERGARVINDTRLSKERKTALIETRLDRHSRVQKTAPLKVRKNAPSKVRKTTPPAVRKTAPSSVQQTAPPINSYSLREEMIYRKGRNDRGAARKEGKAGKDRGAARGKQGKMDLAHEAGRATHTAPESSAKGSPPEDRATQGCDPSAVRRRGGPNPPGRGRKTPASSAARVYERELLGMARQMIADDLGHALSHAMLAELVKAGDALPDSVRFKHANVLATLEEHLNPVPA